MRWSCGLAKGQPPRACVREDGRRGNFRFPAVQYPLTNLLSKIGRLTERGWGRTIRSSPWEGQRRRESDRVNYLAIAILVTLVIGYAVAAVVLAVANAAKAIREAASKTAAESSEALRLVGARLAQRIGRAGQEGDVIEVFEPRLRVSVPERHSEAQLE